MSSFDQVEDDMERYILFGAGWGDIPAKKPEHPPVSEHEHKTKDADVISDSYTGSSQSIAFVETSPDVYYEAKETQESSSESIDEEFPWGKPFDYPIETRRHSIDTEQNHRFYSEDRHHANEESLYSGFGNDNAKINHFKSHSAFDSSDLSHTLSVTHIKAEEPADFIPLPPPPMCLSPQMSLEKKISGQSTTRNPVYSSIVNNKDINTLSPKPKSNSSQDHISQVLGVLRGDFVLKPTAAIKTPISSPKADLDLLKEFDPLLNPQTPKSFKSAPKPSLPISTPKPPPSYDPKAFLHPKPILKK